MDDRSNKTARRGTMIVEAALILPLLVILTFGGLKYGWLFIKWQQTTNVARHAVRYSVRPSASTAETEDLIDELMKKAGMENEEGGTVIYTRTVSYGADDYPLDSIVGDAVTVQIVVTVADVDILKLNALLPTPDTLTATMTMSKEGPGS
ncbi:MAG: TadE/TadG family type IV pilus assembly protein [Planctomycetota bacterium]|jgi:Flp pilus assembly protein TadG